MKKLIALFTAMAFALTLGVAFAEEQSTAPIAPAAPEKKMEEKAPAKKMKKKTAKKKKKAAKKEEMAPAAPAEK